MQMIDGKAVSLAVKTDVRDAIAKAGITPCLAVILVGNDPASRVYVNNKKKACAFCGIRSLEYALPEETTQEELLDLIDKLNRDPAVNGILTPPSTAFCASSRCRSRSAKKRLLQRSTPKRTLTASITKTWAGFGQTAIGFCRARLPV